MTNSHRMRGRAMARGYSKLSSMAFGPGGSDDLDTSPSHEIGIKTGSSTGVKPYRNITNKPMRTETVRPNTRSLDIVDSQLSQSFMSKSIGEINIGNTR